MYTVCRWQQQDYVHSLVDENNRIMYTVCRWKQQDYVQSVDDNNRIYVHSL